MSGQEAHIVILNRQRRKKINTRFLKQIVSALLADLGISHAELGIHLVAAPEMARVNLQFLGHEGSTDVITFDHLNSSSAPHGPPEWIHGELFICVDDAVAQARVFRAVWRSEVVRYVIHGVLHLLGHNDSETALRRKMKRLENRLVRQLEHRFSFTRL